MANQNILNLTKPDRYYRLRIEVGVSYDSNPDEVEAALLEVAKENSSIEQDDPTRKPLVRFQNFGDSTLNFALVAWIKNVIKMRQINSDLHHQVFAKLRAEKIVIAFPQLFYASKGNGAFLNDLYNKGEPKRLHVSNVSKMKQAIVASSLPYNRDGEYYKEMGRKFVALEKEIQSTRKLGMAALTMAYIAAGRLEGYIVTGAKSWDMAGGIAILEEAGGKITNYKGEPYTLDTFEWLASNGHLHENFVEIYK